jgi:diguanylate cyclase (GGDEF)-like protein
VSAEARSDGKVAKVPQTRPTSPRTPRRPLVLIASGDDQPTRWLEDLLANAGFSVQRVDSGERARAWVREASPDLIVLGSDLADQSGLELCRALRDDAALSPTTPIVIVAAEPVTRADRLEALLAGAWERFDPACDREELLLRLEAYVATKLKADASAVESLLDPLTGLYNRQGLARRAREMGSEMYRRRSGMMCVVLTLDPAPGTAVPRELVDAVVRRCGELLRKRGRTSDAIGRLGTTQFGVIAPASDTGGAAALADRLAHEVEDAYKTVGAALPPIDVRVAYELVPNLRYAPIDPLQLLGRASAATAQAGPRRLQSEPG